jgi:hypothetical protein
LMIGLSPGVSCLLEDVLSSMLLLPKVLQPVAVGIS